VKGLLSVVSVVFLLGLSLAGCGGARKTGNSKTVSAKSAQNTPSAKLGGVTPAFAAKDRHGFLEKVAWVRSTSQPHFPNDGDHDEPGDEDKDNNHDTGTGPGATDPYLDYLPPANNRAYHDEDDQAAVQFGHAADSHDLQAVRTTVERYYSAAAALDGAKACSLMAPSFAKAVPTDYGKFGPPYLRGAKTCAGVLTLLFKHVRRELGEPVQVTEVRVKGSTALAFIGSKAMRASVISLNREGADWAVSQTIGAVLQ
jgi:hypothetical protein